MYNILKEYIQNEINDTKNTDPLYHPMCTRTRSGKIIGLQEVLSKIEEIENEKGGIAYGNNSNK